MEIRNKTVYISKIILIIDGPQELSKFYFQLKIWSY